MKLYNEFQEDLKDHTEWRGAGSETIYFSTEPETEECTELYVSEEGYEFDSTGLTNDQYWALDDYAKKVQQHLRDEAQDYSEYNAYLQELSKHRY